MLVKICGIRSLEAASVAYEAGADFIGLNFIPTSKRVIDLKKAKQIARTFKGKILLVGVFQDAPLGEVNEKIDQLKLDFVQLHGQETLEYTSLVRAKVIRAFRLLEQPLADPSISYYLLDRDTQGEGKMVNLEKAASLAKDFPIIFAGGLTPENVASVIAKVQPIGVDVASGVETKGEEDLVKIKKFVREAKGRKNGHYGTFGGRYVPEMLIPALEELESSYQAAKIDPSFQAELADLLVNFVGRPTPLTFAANLTKKLGGAKIYFKNEGLNLTGAHKITHCVGQALLAKRMGKSRLIAETGAGQHGVATATVAAKLGFKCSVYMGEVDMARQRPNVFLMERLGAQVIPVSFGQKTLKDAVNAALKDWIENVKDSYYLLGSALGPHPYPLMVRDFQSVVGKEVKAQIKPDVVVACVGGGSNAIGIFSAFLDDEKVSLIGVEAGGKGRKIGQHAARFVGQGGKIGVVEGYKSIFLQDSDGNLAPTHSISAGLDYPGIGPELAFLESTGRLKFTLALDSEVLAAFDLVAKLEGIMPALESCHALAQAIKLAPQLSSDQIMVVNLSGRADKDLFILAREFKDDNFRQFLKEEYERY